DRVVAVLLVRVDAEYGERERAGFEAYLGERWRMPVSLRLARVRRPPSGGWRDLVAGAFNFYRTARVRALDHADARAAVAAAFADRPRVVVAHRLEAMSVVLRASPAASETKVVFDLDDVEHVAAYRRLVRSPAWPLERLQLLHLPAMIAGERRAVLRA